ncbi:hypothetical protein [Streptomyces olivoreticuli]|uniref:hypothetical protein n=1 Tax=Streptomyces olivoreticuli TaxID=68246 RepID=UPI000E282253|nr:hypothetical protein [Streptomyces olivoreticuli]
MASVDRGDGAKSESKEKAGGGTGENADAEKGRPQLRLDSSQEEEARLWNAYNACLKTNGVEMQPRPGGGEGPAEGGEPKAAYDKCQVKMPLLPPEMDEKKNPQYLDNFRDWVRCINSKGVPVKGKPDGSGWEYAGESGKSETEVNKIANDCKVETFGGGKR